MARPTYESVADRENEERVIAKVAEQLGLKYAKNKMAFEIDYSLFDSRDTIKALAEVKCRSHSWAEYPTLNIAATKSGAAMRWKAVMHVPVLLVVDFAGDIRWCYLHERGNIMLWWGRKDRNDADDMEPSVGIAHGRFYPLEELKL